MDKINKETLIKYLTDNVEISNTLVHSDNSVSIRLDGFLFNLTLHSILYEKHDVYDTIEYEDDELDILFNKIQNFYTKEDLNNELMTLLRNNNIEDITK